MANKHAKNEKTKAANRRKKPKVLSLGEFHSLTEKPKMPPTTKEAPKPQTPKTTSKVEVKPSTNGGTIHMPSTKAKEVPKVNGEAMINGFAKTNGVTFKEKPAPIIILPQIPPAGLRGGQRGRGGRRVRSCPRLPTPERHVPPELSAVDRMTSADFRHDYAAHLENMRVKQKDQQHMQFFQTAIEENQHLFKDRIILVLSCGSGALALMAAQAGASCVYALDYSNVSDYAKLVVKHNSYANVIKVLHGRVSDVELPQPIDGIVCNWMGHCLLYESELVQLLQARDRWLKPNGFILPDLGNLYLLGAAEHRLKNERCNWWLNVYGFNMNAMRRYALAEPRFAKIQGKDLITLAHQVLSLDLRTAGLKDLQISRDIRLKVQVEGYLECFVLYFDVEFSRAHQPLKLSCNPCLPSPLKSLWCQTLLFVEQPFVMRPSARYTGRLIFKALSEEKPLNLNQMEIQLELFENYYDVDHGSPLVDKRWLLMPRFQTVHEVVSCQDKHLAIDRPHYHAIGTDGRLRGNGAAWRSDPHIIKHTTR